MALITPRSQPPSFQRRLLLGNLAIIASLVALAAFSAYQSRLHHEQLAYISLANLSQALSRNLVSVIEKSDLSLRSVAFELEHELSLRGAIDPAALQAVLAEQKSLQPDLHSLRFADPDGVIRYGTEVPPGSRASVADRSYFLRLRNDPEAGLVIDGPHLSKLGNLWVVSIARSVYRRDGSFGGVIFATITAEHFREMLSSLDLGLNGSVTLQMEDHRLIARIPAPMDDNAMSTGILQEPTAERLAAAPLQGSFKAVSALDRIERSYVYQRVGDFPMYIVVGRATGEIFSAWWDEVSTLAGIVAVFGSLALVLLRHVRRAAQGQESVRLLLHEAVESIDAGFWVVDREDRLVICNEAFRNFHPASRHLLIPGTRFEDIVRQKAAAREYPQAAENPEEWIEARLRYHRVADGIPFEQRADQGRHLLTIERRTSSGYTVGNQIDITELAQYREHLERLVEERTAELKDALGQFRILVEQAPTAIAMLDRNMVYLAASSRWMQEYGAHVDHLIGRKHYEVHPDLPESWKEAHRAALAGIPQERDEEAWVGRDGSVRWLSWSVYPWREEQGAIGGIIISSDDVTSRKRAEESVLIAQARFRRLFESNIVGIVIAEAQGRILTANDYYLDILGFSREELLTGQVDWRKVTPPEWLPGDEKALAELEKSGVCRPYEKEYFRKDGTRRAILLADAMLPGEGQILAVVLDITDRKRAEEQVQLLNADLERKVEERTYDLAQSNEALLRSNIELQHFAHAVAHDLQTPLRSIAGFAQLLQEASRKYEDGQVQQWSSLVIDNTRRLQTLIQELLVYTGLEPQGLPFEPVDLQGLMDEVIASLAILIQETGAEVKCGPLPTLSVDRVQIGQVFQNLIENGIKYNRSKPPRVHVSGTLLDNDWIFSVKDNGLGIDPRHYERIFEMFRRLHTYNQVPGTGIGLALCRRIVERHGGRIWVESRPGEGSTFYFTLPVRSGNVL